MDNYFSINHMLDTIVFNNNHMLFNDNCMDFRVWLDSISDIDDRSMAIKAIENNRNKILGYNYTKSNKISIVYMILEDVKYLQFLGEGKHGE